MYSATMSSVVAETYTVRQFQVKQSRLAQGWRRSEFIKHKLKVCRQTAYVWDLTLLESTEDYSVDPNTGESLWEAGTPWNAHQMWALLKVKGWMGRSPKPTLEDLRSHLANNQHLYSHTQFFKEAFNYDPQRTK